MVRSHHSYQDHAPGLAKIRERTAELLNRPLQGIRAFTKKVQKETRVGGLRFANVFAAPLEFLEASSYVPPQHAKTEEEQEFLLEALRHNFVFADLNSDQLMPLVAAMEKVSIPAKEIIIEQGELGDYFYVLIKGTCSVAVDGKAVAEMKRGSSFGELALMYSSPRAATVKALEHVELFRVDQRTFRKVFQAQVHQGDLAGRERLESVEFLAALSEPDKQKLVDNMVIKFFKKGDFIAKKGDEANQFWLVERGDIMIMNITLGDKKLHDIKVGPGDYFGEQALLRNITVICDVKALSDGCAFTINKETFVSTLGDVENLVARSMTRKGLASIDIIAKTGLSDTMLESLVKLVKPRTFKNGEYILQTGGYTEAALYVLRKGSVHLKNVMRDVIFKDVGFFGEDMITLDATTGNNKPRHSTQIQAPYTVQASSEEVIVGVLYLSDCRKVFDTTFLGKGLPASKMDSIRGMMVTIDDFQRHTVLGAGTFGQVWLVSRTTKSKEQRVYALKIQSKYELVKNHQAKGVVHEKEIMADLHHPFITNLVAAFKDDKFVYMLMELVQGGELEGLMHNEVRDELPETEAIFYAAGIAEGLLYMHRRGYIYRDLKPQNVLISNEGYPIIADFGFAKRVLTKTFTFCGTPLYLAPEIILNRGHNWAADHWSLGILIHEMLLGYTPFYEEHMDQMDLFRAIVQDKLHLPPSLSENARSIIGGFLVKKPSKRLGSLMHGLDDIPWHPWFHNIDFDKLRQKDIPAPYVPVIGDPLDTSNFEDWSGTDDKMATDYPKISAADEEIFAKF